MITARFENRSFAPYPHEHWESLQVAKYSKNVLGFSKKATINAFGEVEGLWEFFEMLRCPVYIMDTDRAKEVWWGYINRVTVWDEDVAWSVSLDHMANNIAVVHSYNYQRFTTSWESDTESDAEYGQKDLRLSEREISATSAAQKRSTELAARKFPTPDPGFLAGSRKKIQARLYCKGWFDTLSWQYYAQDEGYEAYEEYGRGEREIGEDDRPTAAQGFQLSSAAGWTATSIWFRVKKVGAPADNFQVALWDDNAGLPNAQIEACAVLAGANITTSYVWYEFVLDSVQALATGTQYWCHASRSGAVNASNYFMIDANSDQGYANGNLYIKPAGAWYNKNMDALFRVTGEDSTTDQIGTIITDSGEFIEGTTIEDASGVDSGTYRSGDQTALYEILHLLKVGTTNNRRLLAEVTKFRKLRVFEEPAKYSATWTMNKKKEIWDEYGVKVLPQDCPVGVWMQLIDFIPSTVNTSKLSDPSPIFIDEAEYNILKGIYRPTKTRSGVSATESLQTGIRIG